MDVIDWLLDSDPAIRWQVMRDLAQEPADVVAAERARVAAEGWGARLLALQAPDGLWAGNAFSQERTDTFHVLELLRRLGLAPESEQARRALGLVREHVTWGDGAWWNPPWADSRFFEGEVEPCINGNVVSTGSYFDVDMAPLVERLAPTLRRRLVDAGLSLEVDVDDAAREAVLTTDEDAIGQILFNLVDNAAKYGKGGSETVELRVKARDGRVDFAVRDHGPGVPAPHRHRIFAPFDRGAVPTASNDVPGVGLGLALARGLARDLGGELVLDETVPDGACFVLTLPA